MINVGQQTEELVLNACGVTVSSAALEIGVSWYNSNVLTTKDEKHEAHQTEYNSYAETVAMKFSGLNLIPSGEVVLHLKFGAKVQDVYEATGLTV